MAVVLGTSSGFVIVAPTADPTGGVNTTIDGSSVVTKHTSPEGANAITEIGWYRGAGTNTANFEIALYSDNAGVANARLFVDATNSSNVQGWIVTAVNWAISANTVYWLAVQMDAHSGSSSIDSETSGGAGIDVLTSQTTLNDPYGGGAVSDADGMMAIYAKVSVARNVAAGLGEVTITGFAPTVVATDHKNVLAGLGEISLTGFAPTVSVTDNKNVQADTGAVSLTGFEPTVSVTSNLNITTDTGGLTLTGFEPTVIASDHKNVLPGTGELTFNGFAPTIETPVNITTSTGEISFTGYEPTVSTGSNTEVQAGTGELVLNGFAPTIETPLNILANTGELTFSGFSPTIETPRNINTGLGEIVFEGFAPTVSIGGGEVLVESDFGQMVFIGHAPLVEALNREFVIINSGIDNGNVISEISEGNYITRIKLTKRIKSKIDAV